MQNRHSYRRAPVKCSSPFPSRRHHLCASCLTRLRPPEMVQWVALPEQALAAEAPAAVQRAYTPSRKSQKVHESSPRPTPHGQHVTITLERTSTGGTRREAQFKKAATGPMSGAERAEKKRKRASLFPQQQASLRATDVLRKQKATAAKATAKAMAAAHHASIVHQQDYWGMRMEEEYWAERAQPYWIMACCGARMSRIVRCREVFCPACHCKMQLPAWRVWRGKYCMSVAFPVD